MNPENRASKSATCMAAAGVAPAVAMTDHGNMFGAVEFYREAVSHGIKPIIGCEIYVAPTSRFEKKGVDKGPKEYNNHLILLAMNREGYRNLCKLVSLGYMEGFYYKPRMDHGLMKAHSKGIIALSSCLAGEVAQAVAAGQYDRIALFHARKNFVALESFDTQRHGCRHGVFSFDAIYVRLARLIAIKVM